MAKAKSIEVDEAALMWIEIEDSTLHSVVSNLPGGNGRR